MGATIDRGPVRASCLGLGQAACLLLVSGLLLLMPRSAIAQLTTSEEEKLQILTDPEALKKKVEKDKNKAPFEFFKSQVAPFDLLPYVKPYHWATLVMELRANDEDYEGYIQSAAVMMPSMPHEMVFRRDARLLKEQRARTPLQVNLMQTVPKEWSLELVRPGAIRPDGIWQASLLTLEPHQMLVMVLAKESTNQYAAWNRLTAMLPSDAERDAGDIEKLRYFRLVLPMDPDKPALSPHPLTWSTISHVIWDGLAPDTLSVSQQQAMLDWLHWGGQMIIIGGAGQGFSLLRDSFLSPYLPAEATGQTVPLSRDDLGPLSQSFPPPAHREAGGDESQPVPLTSEEAIQRFGQNYQAPAPILPAPQRPVQLAVLRPTPGSSTIPLGEASPHLLAVERRVGRGRLTMLGINPNDPALLAWPGIDSVIRRVVLRRPEEPILGRAGFDGYEYLRARRGRLLAHDLSWYRILSRDAGLEMRYGVRTAADLDRLRQNQQTANAEPNDPEAIYSRLPGVADWRDFTTIPRAARDLLDQASGISVPSSSFVLRVLLAYVIAVVPLNWLICRVVLNRREWAWIIVPLVALGFAVGVERMAARNLGYDTASDEIDLLEVYSDYPRAHLTRLGSLYSTGRTNFNLSYPNDPTALALPMDTGRSIRGEQIATSTWQSYPVPALVGLSVEPRSLSLYRAEQMLALKGPIRLEGDGESRKIVNESGQELKDATLVDMGGPAKPKEWYLGTIAAGASVEIGKLKEQPPPERPEVVPGLDPLPFLSLLRKEHEDRSENQGELRLVAWVPDTVTGQLIEPPVDRRRGFTAVVVHLRCGNPPSPDSIRYNLLAQGAEDQMRELLKEEFTSRTGQDASVMSGSIRRRALGAPAGKSRGGRPAIRPSGVR